MNFNEALGKALATLGICALVAFIITFEKEWALYAGVLGAMAIEDIWKGKS